MDGYVMHGCCVTLEQGVEVSPTVSVRFFFRNGKEMIFFRFEGEILNILIKQFDWHFKLDADTSCRWDTGSQGQSAGSL